jgi:hypothetical protein
MAEVGGSIVSGDEINRLGKSCFQRLLGSRSHPSEVRLILLKANSIGFMSGE